MTNKHETLGKLATAMVEAEDIRRRLKQAQKELAELQSRAKPAAAVAKPAAAAKPTGNARQVAAATLAMISAAPTLTRAEFSSLPPAARLKFSQSGGKIGPQSDNKTFAEYMPPVLTRKTFNKLTPAKRLAHVQAGGKLID